MTTKIQLIVNGFYLPETIKDEIKNDFLLSAIGKTIIQKRKIMKFIKNADSTSIGPYVCNHTGLIDVERYWFCNIERNGNVCQYQSTFCQVCGNYKLSFQDEIPESAFCYCDLPKLLSIVDENENDLIIQDNEPTFSYETFGENDYEAICVIS